MINKMAVSSILVIALIASVQARTVYVSSLSTSLYAQAERSSKQIASLNKGTGCTVLAEKGGWLQVSAGGKQGWLQKLFTSSIKPGDKVSGSVFGAANSNARIQARVRASANVTAASARGLLDKGNSAINSRSRSGNSAGPDDAGDLSINMQVLSAIEGLSISEKELLEFLKSGGIK